VRASVNATRATTRQDRENVEDFACVRDLRRRASLLVSATRFGLTQTLW
jgi:hypothetical protein